MTDSDSAEGVLTTISTIVSTSTILPNGVTYIYTSTFLPPDFRSAVSTTEASTLSNGVFSAILSFVVSTISPQITSTPVTTQSMSSSTTPPSGTNATFTSSSPTGNHTSRHGLTTPEKAGVGVGSAIAGALLLFAGVCIFLRLPKRRRGQGSGDGDGAGGRIKSIQSRDTLEKSNGLRVSNIPIDYVLVERVDDSQIKNTMRDLNEFIYQHVENHYHLRQLSSRLDDIKQGLIRLDYTTESSPSTNTLASLLANPRTRRTAIRLLIASVMFENIGSNSVTDPRTSLLPGDILASYQAFQRTRGLPVEQEGSSKSFTEWCNLNPTLLASSAPKHTDSRLNASIAHNVSRLNPVLQLFIGTDAESQRSQKENLSSIFLEGAKFGILLLSQPGEWVFGWDESRKSVRDERIKLVVFPFVGEVIERSGRPTVRLVVESVDEDI